MIAIINGKVYTISNGILENATVLIKNGKIEEVGPEVVVPEGADVIDAAGKVVFPGLIDPHCHTGIFPDGIGWEHSDGNELTDPITPHLRAIDALHPNDPGFPDLVSSGVTTILTGPGSGNLVCPDQAGETIKR